MSAADGKFLHARGGGGAIFLQQSGKLFKVQHIWCDRWRVSCGEKTTCCSCHSSPVTGHKLARPARVERATLCLEGRCSIHLSYGRRQRDISGSAACAQARLVVKNPSVWPTV